jgi:hypothetical protein
LLANDQNAVTIAAQMKSFPREFFQKAGAEGGKKSRRKLTPEQAREMVKAREEKRKTNDAETQKNP